MPTLKQITTRAKQIRKAKPRTKWQNAIKQASKELKAKYRKKEGKVGKKKTVKRKRITGYQGWTIKGKHNVIYAVIYRGSVSTEFHYVTTTWIAADRYIRAQKLSFDTFDLYVKEFIA